MIIRRQATALHDRLTTSAAVALLGPRQVGKTTLARQLADTWPTGAVYLDLERPADLRRVDDADAYLRSLAPRLAVLDEVHRSPGLFEVLRGVIDDNRRAGFRTGQFLLLGSASLDLIQLSSESLAGRISHLELAGINVDEARDANISGEAVWLRGGFPDSLTAGTDRESAQWRTDLIRSYLERDVPMFAPRLPAEALRRLWTMIAHTSGGLLNASRLATNIGVSSPTVDRYIDLLADLGLVRRLQPWHLNVGKRVTKSPKVFVRDSGLLHSLLEIDTLHELRGHPVVGASFESFAVEAIIDAAGPSFRPHHYRTASGDEIDLVLVRGGQPEVAVEVKLSTSPTLSAGFHRACNDLGVTRRYVVHPDTGSEAYTASGATVIGLTALVGLLR
ncbi:MAG: ATP-binding protein [Propionibacteriaceae bacterium]